MKAEIKIIRCAALLRRVSVDSFRGKPCTPNNHRRSQILVISALPLIEVSFLLFAFSFHN